MLRRDGGYATNAAVDPRVGAVVFVPPDPVSTEVARGLLPAQVPHADAAANAGRAALLVAALPGRPEPCCSATRDLLHQGYREPAMPGSLALVAGLRGGGHRCGRLGGRADRARLHRGSVQPLGDWSIGPSAGPAPRGGRRSTLEIDQGGVRCGG